MIMRSVPVPLLTITMVLIAGCPPGGQPQPSLDFTGLVFEAQDFWPFAEGNYWLWMDPEYPDDWYSKKVVKSREIAGVIAYLVESRNAVGAGEVFAFEYIIAHPKGLYRTLSEDTLLQWAQTPESLITRKCKQQ